MTYSIRIVLSRIFALWILLIVCMSSVPLRTGSVTSSVNVLAPTVMSGVSAIRVPRVSVHRPSSAVMCLAQTLFFEARNQPVEGLRAVAATVFNRVDHAHYASSVCAVVYQPYQYSWTLIRSNWQRRPPNFYMQLATAFIENRESLQEQYPVTHFHRFDVHPQWSDALEYVITIGHHKFYRG